MTAMMPRLLLPGTTLNRLARNRRVVTYDPIALTHATKAYYKEMDGGARLEQIRRGSEKELLE